jgi:hypothetical protein
MTDFEDAVCVAAAEAADCELVVTRDPQGFAGSPVRVVDPTTALALLSAGRTKTARGPTGCSGGARRPRPGRPGSSR